jgi:hypothetical protein
MSLLIPKDLQARIGLELATLPAVHGKVSLTITFNCTMNKIIGSMKVKREIEEEIRP